MKTWFDKLDLWIYNLLGWLFLLSTFVTDGVEETVLLVGAGMVFGIQVIIWRLNDSKPK